MEQANKIKELVNFRIRDQRVQDLDPGFKSRLISMLQAMPEILRNHITIGSAKRYYQEQAERYRQYQNGNTGLTAKPGTSKHEYGEAVDFHPADHRVRWNSKNSGFNDAITWIYENGPDYGIRGLSIFKSGNKIHDPSDPIHFQMMTKKECQNHTNKVINDTRKKVSRVETKRIEQKESFFDWIYSWFR